MADPGASECCGDDAATRYQQFRAFVARRFEEPVLGSDYGADGYTTRVQADDLAGRLRLEPSDRLFDLGAGAGWPGLYLAAKTGCCVFSVDIPEGDMRQARARARRACLGSRAMPIRANGPRLPFTSASFDAIVHSDVLCCLRPKLAVLHECRRVLRPSGRMAFYVIHPSPGLPGILHRRALRTGPPHVSLRGWTYPDLLQAAGFEHVRERDLTADYRSTLQAKLEIEAEHADEVAGEWGADMVKTLRRDRIATIAAVDDGLLHRALYTGCV